MLMALWLGSLVIWGAVKWDGSVLRQWQTWQTTRRVEQQAELALAMMTASLDRASFQHITQREGRLECMPSGCRSSASHLLIRPGAHGVALLIKGESEPDVGYTVRDQSGISTLWMNIAGKGTAVAVVNGITGMQWMPDVSGTTGRLQVTASSGGDQPILRTLTQTVTLGGLYGRT